MATKDIHEGSEHEGDLPLLLSMLEDNTIQWREMIGSLSQEEILWQPYPNGHSIGAIILHNAHAEAYWLHEVITGEPLSQEMNRQLLAEEIDQFAGVWATPPAQPLMWYYAQQDAIRKRTRTILRDQHNPLALFGTGRQFTLRWLLHHVITHEAYHCGQMSLLASQFRHRSTK